MRPDSPASRRPPRLDPLVRLLAVAGLLVVAVAAGVVGAAAAPRVATVELAPAGYCPHADEPAASPRAEIAGMSCLVNYARRAAGLSVLTASTLLREAASMRAHGDLRCDQFSHTPCGTPFTATFRRSGYLRNTSQFVIGENLAYSAETASPRSVMLRWLRSPDHRANILDPRFSQMGLVVYRVSRFGGYSNVALWVNDFGRRTGECPAAASLVVGGWVRTVSRELTASGSPQSPLGQPC